MKKYTRKDGKKRDGYWRLQEHVKYDHPDQWAKFAAELQQEPEERYFYDYETTEPDWA